MTTLSRSASEYPYPSPVWIPLDVCQDMVHQAILKVLISVSVLGHLLMDPVMTYMCGTITLVLNKELREV